MVTAGRWYLDVRCTEGYTVAVWSGLDWNVEVRKGVLELCILGLLARGPSYGYEIVQALSVSRPLAAAEGTVYPLLRRLREAGSLGAYWQESDAGPPRQYYRITPEGRRRLAMMRRDWKTLVEAVDSYTVEEVVHASA